MPSLNIPKKDRTEAERIAEINKWYQNPLLNLVTLQALVDAYNGVMFRADTYYHVLANQAHESGLDPSEFVPREEARVYTTDKVLNGLHTDISPGKFMFLEDLSPKHTDIENWLSSDSAKDFDLSKIEVSLILPTVTAKSVLFEMYSKHKNWDRERCYSPEIIFAGSLPDEDIKLCDFHGSVYHSLMHYVHKDMADLIEYVRFCRDLEVRKAAALAKLSVEDRKLLAELDIIKARE